MKNDKSKFLSLILAETIDLKWLGLSIDIELEKLMALYFINHKQCLINRIYKNKITN